MRHQPPPGRAYRAASPLQQHVRTSALLYDEAGGGLDDSYAHAYADSEPSPLRPFAETDDGADTEEDELMRMIVERERLEAQAEARVAAKVPRGNKAQRFQMPPRNMRPSAVQVNDEFYSPVRPADAANGSSVREQQRGHAPFRGARVVVSESHRYKQPSSPVYSDQRERQTKFVNFQIHGLHQDSHRDVISNQVEHDVPQQHHQHSMRDQRKRDRTQVQDADGVWDLFLHGTSGDDDASHRPNPSRDVATGQNNIFREEISLSTSVDSGFATANESTANRGLRGPAQQQHQPSSGSFSIESTPHVSYSPPMSPARTNSSQQSSDRWRRSEDSSHVPNSLSPAVFPFWSVAFLLSCVVVGVSGFLIEHVMDLLGKFSKSASTLSLSKHEQKQMHTRLEQLQSEIHGFRYTASEIEVHSQRVFAEVKTHLDRMKSEREKHQLVIAREMNDLRAYMLHMMSDMVEQEHELIHTRLKHVAAVEETTRKAVYEVERPAETALDGSEPSTVVKKSEVTQPAEQLKQEVPPVVDVSTVIQIETPPAVEVLVQIENASLKLESVPPAPAAALSRGEGVMLMSWELLMMLTAMSILGGLVGLRVRNVNRRKRWFEQRRIRRELRATLEQERAAREAEEDEDEDASDEDDSDELGDSEEGEEDEDEVGEDTNSEDDWDDGVTESSIETVSLLRRATGLTPLGRMQAPSSDDDDDGDDDENGGEPAAKGRSERKKVRFQS